MAKVNGVPKEVEEAVVSALIWASQGEHERAFDCLEIVGKAADGTNGSLVYGACYGWATAINQMAHGGEIGRYYTELVPVPGSRPTADETDRATALAAYLTAVFNGDDAGALAVWAGTESPEHQVRLTWDVLCVAGLLGAEKLKEAS